MDICTSLKVLPYVYMCTHKHTNKFYIGLRYKNKHPSSTDLGNFYFTSSFDIRKDNFKEFDLVIIAEFFEADDAYDFEQQLIGENWDNPLIMNKSWDPCDGKRKFKNCVVTRETRKKHKQGLEAFRNSFTDLEWSERLSEFASTAKFYNNGVEEKRFYSDEVPEGWAIGIVHTRTGLLKANDIVRKKLSEMTDVDRKKYCTHRQDWSTDSKNSQANKMKNKRWINNGTISQMVDQNEINLYMTKGWSKGRGKHKG